MSRIKYPLIGYIATNTKTGEQLPAQPTPGETVHAIMSRATEMLQNREVAGCKIWEISAGTAEVEAEEGAEFCELCALADLTGAWEESRFAFLFAVTLDDLCTFHPFAPNCAK